MIRACSSKAEWDDGWDDGFLAGDGMPKRTRGLTAREVEMKKEPGLYGDGNNLYLQVERAARQANSTGGVDRETGKVVRSWIFRYQVSGATS